MDFSVLLLNYNASEDQMDRTIQSVVKQKDVEFEIIVCDDYSKDNHFDYIEALFESYGFTNYTMLPAEKNVGTVRNILRGLEVAKGKYAKPLGMGDLLYDDMTLKKVYDFMSKDNLRSCFGLINSYTIKDGETYPAEHTSPFDIELYRNMNVKRLAKNIVLAEDWVSGVCIFGTTEYYKYYLGMMKDRVIYCEDWATGLAMVDGEYLKLLDEYVVVYEVGTGVTTDKKNAWRNKLLEDGKQFWQLFTEYATEKGKINEYQKYLRLNARKKRFDNVEPSSLQFALKAITNPSLILFWAKVMMNKNKR